MITHSTFDQEFGHLAEAYENLGDSVTIVDNEGILLGVNSACEKLFGYSREELIGQSVSILAPDEDLVVTLEMIKSSPGARWQGEVIRNRKNGEVFPGHLTITLLKDSSGEVAGRIGILRDLSELKKFESEIRRDADERAVLAEIGRVINSSLDINEVYDRFTEEVQKIITFDRIAIGNINEDKTHIRHLYIKGVDMPSRTTGTYQPMKDALAEYPVKTRSAVLFQPDSIEEGINRFPGIAPLYESGIRSTIVVPLITDDDIIGILYLDSKRTKAYTDRDLELAERIGLLVSGAIANSQLHAELERDNRERQFLAEIGRIIGSSLNLDEVYDEFAGQVRELIPFDMTTIATADFDKNTFTFRYVAGGSIPGREVGHSEDLDGSITKEIIESGKGMILNIQEHEQTLERFPRLAPLVERGYQSQLSVPLINDGKGIGAIHFNTFEQGAYRKRDLELAERIGLQIAGAIANSQLHSELSQRAIEQEGLAKIGKIVSSSLDIDEVYDGFVQQVNELIPSDRIAIVLTYPESNQIIIAYTAGLEVPQWQRGMPHNLRGTATEWVTLSRESLIIQDDNVEELLLRFPTLNLGRNVGLNSRLCVPLVSNDQPIGTLTLDSKQRHAYTNRDLLIAEHIGSQIAGTIANSQLHLKLRDQANEQETISKIGRIIGSSLNMNEVYDRFSEEMKKLLAFDIISLNVIEEQDDTTIVWNHSGLNIPGRQQGNRFPLPGTLAGHTLEHKGTTVIQKESPQSIADRLPGLKPILNVGMKSFISTVLFFNGRVIGVLSAATSIESAYSDKDIEIVERVSTQIAGAVANSQLHHEIRHQAKEQQVLAEIGRIINSSLDIGDVYEQFASHVKELLPFDRISINLAILERGTISTAYESGVEIAGWERGAEHPLGNTSAEALMASRKSMLTQGEDFNEAVQKFPALKSGFEISGLQSRLSVPLISNDQPIGVLILNSLEANAYEEKDIYLAEQIGNQIAGAVANSQLYEAHRQAEEALRLSEETQRSITQSSPDYILKLDLDGVVQFINRPPRSTTIEGFVGKPIYDFVPEEYKDPIAECFHRVITTAQSDRYEIGYHQEDGSRTLYETRVGPITKDGEVISLTLHSTDVTEREQLKQQLVQSQKMEAIGQLAGGVAHDFNNMLSAIISYTHLASMQVSDDERTSGYLEEVQKASDRASQLIRQLLAFSRKQIIEPRVLDLNRIILDLDKMLRRLISEEIEMVTLPDGDLGKTKIDPGQIEQILMNLAINASDAMPEGGKLIIETGNITLDEDFVRHHADVNPGEYVMLSVSDNGTGMTEEVQSHIFEPFFTTKEVGKGTGLGLSTCYGIVAQNGGLITVESESEQGTTFKIYLPRVYEETSVRPLRDDQGYLPSGNENVLIVEDEPLVREVACHVLQQQGYTILEAANGDEALRIAQGNGHKSIDLLLTDMVMPIMGGRELAEHLREINPETQVLYASGYTDDAIVRQEIMEDGSHFIQKPFTPAALARKVREILDATN